MDFIPLFPLYYAHNIQIYLKSPRHYSITITHTPTSTLCPFMQFIGNNENNHI